MFIFEFPLDSIFYFSQIYRVLGVLVAEKIIIICGFVGKFKKTMDF